MYELEIQEVLENNFKILEKIDSSTNLIDFGFESLSFMELSTELSKKLNINIPISEVIKWTTVQSVADSIMKNQNEPKTTDALITSGYTVNSIVIDKKIQDVFLIINNIENWPLLHNYRSAKLISKTKLPDSKVMVLFKIEQVEEGEDHIESWISQRTIDPKTLSARGVRRSPIFPFSHWILDVELSEDGNGTKMTWTQDFSMDKKSGYCDKKVEELINKVSKDELLHFKNAIESSKVSAKLNETFFD